MSLLVVILPEVYRLNLRDGPLRPCTSPDFPDHFDSMPSRCFVCRLRRKGCVQAQNLQSCDACQRMHIECMPCTMKIPNVIRVCFRHRGGMTNEGITSP
ncbi:uncharacterized protein EI90DRAFT_2308390 [Cantharellus anzutake]|uniref:uncharacterized protein n=1 Tax=Cantharellus anzutake TaxID=1750568 RepID=UPI001906D63F|nr:uncharacterized protein EI90DRAFT_2308390 [Cantharellus anzutake]KAF8339950.1 hypothetical protein EI90DRAFT_2308390 [Cantharellus anzutake]